MLKYKTQMILIEFIFKTIFLFIKNKKIYFIQNIILLDVNNNDIMESDV